MEELLVNINVQGEENISSVDGKLNKVSQSGNKTTNAFSQMRKEMRDAKADMLTYAEGTDQYNAAMQRAAASADKMRDMQDKIRASQKDAGVVAKNITGAISGLAGAFSTAQGVMTLFGIENEDATKALLKIQSVMSVTSGIAQFADSLDNFKDLYNGLKINILATAAAKSKETVASVENTVANTAEAAAITATGTAAKITAKSLALTLGPYVAITAAIAGIAFGVSKLIKKMNEVPKEIKVRTELEESVGEKMKDEYTKAITFSNNYYNAVKSGDKDRIARLKEIGKTDFGLDDKRLERIAKNKKAWKDNFTEYLKNARQTYLNEAVLKKELDAEVEYEMVRQKVIMEYDYYHKLIGLRSEYNKNDKKFAKENEERIKSEDKILDKLYEDFYKTSSDYIESVQLRKKVYKEVENKKSDYNSIDGGSGYGGGSGSGGGNTTTEGPKIKTIKELKAELAAEGINEINEKRKQQLAAEIAEKAREEAYRSGKEKLPTPIEPGNIKPIDISGITETKTSIEDKGNELLQTINTINAKIDETEANAYEAHKYKKEKILSDVKYTIDSLNIITDNIVSMYDNALTALDNYYTEQENDIKNSTKNEKQKNKEIDALEQERYNKQKKLFDQQKAFKIANAWVNFASGAVAAVAGGIEQLGPIAGPIVGGSVAASLLATTIAQTVAINKQKMEAPTPLSTSDSSSSSSSSASSAVSNAIASLNPSKTSMTTNEENLGMIYASNTEKIQSNVVLVSDINKVQSKVNIRENNTTY
jgi:hypothetical protein